jgi:hypothetical protein
MKNPEDRESMYVCNTENKETEKEEKKKILGLRNLQIWRRQGFNKRARGPPLSFLLIVQIFSLFFSFLFLQSKSN